jgi:hypothetical protein
MSRHHNTQKNCIKESNKSLENVVTIIYIIFAELDEEKIQETRVIIEFIFQRFF